MGFNAEGVFEKTDLNGAVKEIETIFKNSFGGDFITDAASPQGQLIMEMAKHLLREEEKIMELLNSFNVDNLSGVSLDYQAEYKGLKRLEALPCVFEIEALVDVSKDAAKRVHLEKGSELTRSLDGLECFLLEAADSDEKGKLSLKVSSKASGDINVMLGEEFSLKSPNADITSMKSSMEAKGRMRESDESLLHRYQSLQFQIGDKDVFIQGQLLEYAEHVRLINNKSLDIIEGVPSGHFEAIAYGVHDEKAFISRLFQLLDVATPMFGTKSVSVRDSSGISQTLKYTPAKEVTVHVEMMFAKREGMTLSTSDAKTIKEKILFYYASQKDRIGKNIYSADLMALLQDESLFISDMKLYREGTAEDLHYELAIDGHEIAIFKEENIQIGGISS